MRLTRDGHLVCVHDRRVDRTSTGRGVVSELTLDRLDRLDYASWHTELPDSADDLMLRRTAAAERERGVLTLDALLGLVSDSRAGTRLFVETKHPVRYGGLVEARLVELLRRHGLAAPRAKEESRVVMMSFAPTAVRRVRKLAPRVPTVLLLRQIWPFVRDGALPSWADYTGPGIGLVRADPGYVLRSAERGNPTYCWTVDRPDDVRLCERLGVRFLATNSPAATREILAAG